MPLLQVRDFPQETYQVLVQVAKEQNRTVPQQVIFFLTSILNEEKDSYKGRRQKALAGLEALNLHLPPDAPSPAELVRRDRDGLSKRGRLR
jgi:hypothetical protein